MKFFYTKIQDMKRQKEKKRLSQEEKDASE